MILSKLKAYLFFVYCFICLVFFYQSVWLFSDVVNSQVIGFTVENRRPKEIELVYVKYQVNGKSYTRSFMKGDLAYRSKNVEIRYLKFLPGIARVNSFLGFWGFAIITSVVYFSIITIIFLRKDIVPNGSKFQLSKHKPFVKLIRFAEIRLWT